VHARDPSDEQREFSFTLASERMYAKSGPDRIEIRDRNNLSAGTRSGRLQVLPQRDHETVDTTA
jgi:hypothetical protein